MKNNPLFIESLNKKHKICFENPKDEEICDFGGSVSGHSDGGGVFSVGAVGGNGAVTNNGRVWAYGCSSRNAVPVAKKGKDCEMQPCLVMPNSKFNISRASVL